MIYSIEVMQKEFNMNRPTTYSEVYGNKNIREFSKKRINQGTYPDVTLFHGESGVGKTTLAFINALALTCTSDDKPCGKCDNCLDTIENLFKNGKSSRCVTYLCMSEEDKGVTAAKESLNHLTKAFTDGVKVVIYDECHRMSPEAQDVLLPKSEFLEKGIYMIFSTTELLQIVPALQTRALPLEVSKPSRKEMIELLTKEAMHRNLTVSTPAIYELIASDSDDTPRTALRRMEALGVGGQLDYNDVKNITSTIDTSKLIPILSHLEGSLLVGLDNISKIETNKKTQKQIAEFLIEAIRIKEGQASRKLTREDMLLVKEAVADVSYERLVNFCYDIAAMQELTTVGLTAAFLKGHPKRQSLVKHDNGMLTLELNSTTIVKKQTDKIQPAKLEGFQSMDALLSGGAVVKESEE